MGRRAQEPSRGEIQEPNSVSVLHMVALGGGFLEHPVLLPCQRAVDNACFANLLALENRIQLVNFFFTKSERKSSKRQRYRELYHWPLLQELMKQRTAQAAADALAAAGGLGTRLDLGLGLDAEPTKKRSRAPALGQSQLLTLRAQLRQESCQVRSWCSYRLRGLWLELNEVAFAFLFKAFRHWKDTRAGVMPQKRRKKAEREEEAEESEDDEQGSDSVGMSAAPRFWRSMWVVKFKANGSTKYSQKTFSVRTVGDPSTAEFESRKEQRLQEALEWRKCWARSEERTAGKPSEQSEDGEGEMASAYS